MHFRSEYIAIIFVFTSICSLAKAADIQKEMAKCAQMKGDLERLLCFDGLAHVNGVDKPKDATPSIVGKGKWDMSVEINPVDDTKTVTLTLLSEMGKSRWGAPVELVIRCKSNETNLYISWNDYLGDEAHVLTRIGKGQAITENWSLSTDSQATFYPRSPIQFVRKLMVVDNLVAQITPYNESPVTATFDTKGLQNAIKPLQETCNWHAENDAEGAATNSKGDQKIDQEAETEDPSIKYARLQEEHERKMRDKPQIDRYVEIVKQKVERNWIQSTRWSGLSSLVQVSILPGGDVKQVKTKASSGNPLFDKSIEDAILKSSPLPVPSASDPLFDWFRELELVFTGGLKQ